MINDRIIELAESMSEAHQGKKGGDPFKAFDDYGALVIEDDFGSDFEGLTRYSDNEYQIFINTSANKNTTAGRRRFTAAHELAHYSIKEHRNTIRQGGGVHISSNEFRTDAPMEREADIFASHFLIPSKKLLKSCKSEIWGADTILEVANTFETSITCAALRCQHTLPGDSTLIFWGKNSVQWKRMNRDWWFKFPGKTIRNTDELVKGSATEETLRGCTIGDKYLKRGSTSSAWFSRIANWSSKNDLLIEYAIPLGDYGVLTLLRPDYVFK